MELGVCHQDLLYLGDWLFVIVVVVIIVVLLFLMWRLTDMIEICFD